MTIIESFRPDEILIVIGDFLIDKTYHTNVSGCGDVFDISFCNNFYILGQDPIKAFKNAVDSATLYAYSPVEERL